MVIFVYLAALLVLVTSVWHCGEQLCPVDTADEVVEAKENKIDYWHAVYPRKTLLSYVCIQLLFRSVEMETE